MSRLALDGATVRYGAHVAAAEVSFQAAAAEWVALVGPNGSGKSSLLRAVAGVAAYDGSIRVGDKEVSGLRRRHLARLVALVPQNPIFPLGVTVVDYVLLGRTPHIGFFGSESQHDTAVAMDALERLDLAALATRPVGSLSGGEAQRAVVARALAQEAELLLLDEPTTSLDIGHSQQLLEVVRRLVQEGETVVAAFHDLTTVAAYADRVVLLDEGCVVAAGAPETVLTPAQIERIYGVAVVVLRDDRGRPVVVPRAASVDDAVAEG